MQECIETFSAENSECNAALSLELPNSADNIAWLKSWRVRNW